MVFGRDAGERSRGGLAPVHAKPGQPAVWDGRFEVNLVDARTVRALGGRGARMAAADRAALKAVPARLRPALPVAETASGAVFCPLFTMPEQARSLVGERWLAACGAVTREQEIPG